MSKSNSISYEVIRSNRKTADIVVERDGSIMVRAPRSLNDAQIEELVRSKRFWIYKTKAEWEDLNASRVIREYKSGEGFLYLGRNYKLRLVSGMKQPLLLKNGCFQMSRDLVSNGDIDSAKGAFREYFIERGEQRIPKRVGYFAPKVGVEPGKISIRELGNRWASCTKTGRLNFHWKSLMAPQTVIDYIIVHELCHLIHRDHTKEFWNEVDKVMPEWRERKEWLRKNGASLDV